MKIDLDISKLVSEGKTHDEIMKIVAGQVDSAVEKEKTKAKEASAKALARDNLINAIRAYSTTCFGISKKIVDTFLDPKDLTKLLIETEEEMKDLNLTSKKPKDGDFDSISTLLKMLDL